MDGVVLADNEKPSLGGEAIDKHISYLAALKKKGYLDRTLISHDGNLFTSSSTDTIRQFDAIFTHLIPRLHDEGFSKKEINQLLVENPKEAFKIRIRKGP